MNVKFMEWDCEVQFAHYSNGRTGIRLIDQVDGEPIATATVNLPNEPLGEGEVIVKDYSENAGMLKALMDAGIVSAPSRYVSSGFITAPVCILLYEPSTETKH